MARGSPTRLPARGSSSRKRRLRRRKKHPEADMSQGGQGPCTASGRFGAQTTPRDRLEPNGTTPSPKPKRTGLANARACERPPFRNRKGNPRFKKSAVSHPSARGVKRRRTTLETIPRWHILPTQSWKTARKKEGKWLWASRTTGL